MPGTPVQTVGMLSRLVTAPQPVERGRRRCPLCDEQRGYVAWREAGRRYLRCVRCGVMYSDLSADEYEREARNVWDDEAPDAAAEHFYGEARKAAHERFLDLIGPAEGRTLLDVGCGLGYLLERARNRGWNVSGCDTSPSWVNIANRRLGGERVRLATIQQLDPTEQHDVVCAWDVVEHIFDPLDFLRAIAERVASNGVVFLRTPNLAYLQPVYTVRRRLGHASAELGPTNHVVYFTARTMRAALESVGMRVVGIPVLPPPLISVEEWKRTQLGRWSVGAKSGWYRIAGFLSEQTRGRVVLGSDLDVLARVA